MDKDNEKLSKEDDNEPTKIVEQALTEMEKTFGLGMSKKSRIVSRGFTLNEIVESSN